MQLVSEERAIEALGRIKAGGTLTDESKQLGLRSNQPLRKALISLLGSREKYSALLQGGGQARSEAGDERRTRSSLLPRKPY